MVRRVVKKGIVYAGKEAPKVNERLAGQPGHGRGGRRVGGHRVGRHPLLGPAARSDPGAPPGTARRGAPDRVAVAKSFRPSGVEEDAVVHVADGRNTYLLANFSDDRLVGKIVTGQRVQRRHNGSPTR